MDTKSEGIYSTPAMVEDVLYFGTDSQERSVFYAVDSEIGSALWTFSVPTQIFSTPAVADGVVYFHARDDHVYALSAGDGKVRWKTPAPCPQSPNAVFSDMTKSSPAVTAERIFVGLGRELVSLNRATGKVLWRAGVKGKVDSSPLVIGGTVYAGSDDRRFYAFEAGSGRITWEFLTGGKVSSSPSAGGGILVIGSNDGCLYAFKQK